MLKSEFSELTGFYPTDVMYMAIENAYMGYNGSKRDFCRDFRDNKDGMAEAIAERADRSHARVMEKAGLLMKETEELKKRLEREQEWRPYEYEGDVKESEYQAIARSPGVERLSVSEARKRVAEECGFAEGAVIVISETNRAERNRHGQIRPAGKFSREPLWGSTDENYIRFAAGGRSYELYNGDLRIV